METVDLFLLGGNYRTVNDDVVVELFGRTRAGEPIVARYYGFRPYFMLTEPTEETLTRLKGESEVTQVEPTKVWVAGADHPAVRVTIHSPWRVPEFREKYRKTEGIPSVLACDIPFIHRFLYDKDLGLTVQFEAEEEPAEVAALYAVARVVRVVTSEGHDIRATDPFRPTLTTLAFDIENAIRERTIFTICGVVERGGTVVEKFRLGQPDEREILSEFAKIIERTDPDVITGYNIGGYDIPLLLERAAALGMGEPKYGRDRSATRDAGERLWRISGRVVADAWWSVRKELHPKQESLQFVARTLLGDKKLDVDRRNIGAEWLKDRERVMEYCEHDADLALRILQRLRTIDKAADLATVAHLPLEEGLNGRTSLFIDAILIPRADRQGIGVPPSHRTSRENPIEGGYVHTIKPGIYRWVAVLDFKSMYPTIIISKNICFTTLSPEGATVSPSGARFLTPEVRPGIIPQILRELLADRERFRSLSRSADTPERAQYYDGLQNAVKILMNSFYGVLASSFYRFTDKEIGAAITSFARESITGIIKSLEADGHEVVYSDTDSVFVRSPVETLEGAREFGEGVSRRFTAAGVTFEFQSVYASLFSHGAKKRYVGRTVWPKEELVIRGYETRRTDAFDYQSEALLEVFDLVLNGDTDRAVSRSRELVQQCRAGQVPVEKLVIARSVRAEEQYNEATRDSLPFLRVFRRLKEEGYDVIPGMKVAWVVTDAKKAPQEVEPWIDGRPFLRTADYAYYADRVAQTLARVTEVFDWDAAALLRGSHQQRLVSDEGASKAAGPSAPAATLDTPVTALGTPPKRRATTRSLTEFD
ncbi:MAG: DNA polymerase II [Thermoplasmata archaeon]|nr:DNA polymerase II [Thermoplasmata archaeon]